MFFYANDNGDGGSGDNDDQVNIFSIFKGGRRKNQMPHLKKKKKKFSVWEVLQYQGGVFIHVMSVPIVQGNGYLLLGGRIA